MKCFLLAIVCLWPATATVSAKSATDPIIRIDADTHTAAIRCMATDASGKLVLTCSEDKTARLWAMSQDASGRWHAECLRTLRPPLLEDSDEGMLHACALSSDGKLAAVTGKTGGDIDPARELREQEIQMITNYNRRAVRGGNVMTPSGAAKLSNELHIYIFDTATGRMVHRLQGFSMQKPRSLAFSPSGKTLAATMGSIGLHLFDVATGHQFAWSKEMGGSGLAWCSEDRIAVTTREGSLRLYQVDRPAKIDTDLLPINLKLMLEKTTPLGQELYSARLSPDGTRLAVGFADVATVGIFDAKNLRLLDQINGRDLPAAGEMNAVTWLDDHRIAANINFSDGRASVIRLWSEEAIDPPQDIMLPGVETIYALCSLAGDVLGFVGDPAAWGVVNGGAKTAQFLGKTATADFRQLREGLRLSSDASLVGFSFTKDGKSPAVFSIKERRIIIGAAAAQLMPTLRPPSTQGLPIKDWQDSEQPMVKDYKLDLIGHPMIHSLAIAPDSSFFIFGSADGISRHRPSGRPEWWVYTGSIAWAVNISEDARTAVAAYADGTIRWHDLEHQGKVMLVLYPHADQRRWVLWAPASGFVDTEECDRYRGFQDLEKAMKAASLEPGVDVITAIDGKTVSNVMSALSAAMSQHRPGESMKITFSRGSKSTSSVTLLLHPQQMERAEAGTYFDCAPGAEELTRWHFNQNTDQTPITFPSARFRAVFYRPDVIQRTLALHNVNAALAAANNALGKPTKQHALADIMHQIAPPVVEIMTGSALCEHLLPADANGVKVRYTTSNVLGMAPTKLQARLNGRPLDAALPLPEEPTINVASITKADRVFNRSPRVHYDIVETYVPLSDGADGTLEIVARTDLTSSEAAVLKIKRTSPPTNTRKPDLYIIAAGVSKLQANIGLDTDGDGAINDAEFLKKFSSDSIILDDLKGADADARRVGELFHAEEIRTYGKIISKVLTNEQATATALRTAIKDVTAQARAGDVFIFFFAGHGYADEKREFFLATHDVHPDKPEQTSLTGSELAELLDPIKARVVLMLDTCQAGAVLGRREGAKIITGPEDLTGLVNTLSSAERGIVVLSSSSESELSFESEDGGYFTRALMEGIQGKATRDGAVTCVRLQDYITKRVPELLNENGAIKAQGLTQTPTVIMPKGAPDFVLAKP